MQIQKNSLFFCGTVKEHVWKAKDHHKNNIMRKELWLLNLKYIFVIFVQ